MNEQKIDQFFEEKKDQMIEDILRLIRIPSIVTDVDIKRIHPYGEDAARCVDEFLLIADRMGFSTKNLDYYAAYADYGEGKRAVDLLAHLDVVAANGDWTVTQPFSPCIKDGNIYGRGAADDKGPAIAALYAMYAIKELGIPLKKAVRMVAGSNEENGGREDLKHYYDHEQPAEATISPDADYPIINVEKGYLRGKVKASYATNINRPAIISIDAGTKRFVIPGTASATVKGIPEEKVRNYVNAWSARMGLKADVGLTGSDNKIQIVVIGTETHVGAPQRGNNALTGMLDLLCGLMDGENNGALEQLRTLHKVFPHGDYTGKAAGIARKTEDSGELYCTLNIFHYRTESMDGSFDCKTPMGTTESNSRDILVKKLKDGGVEVENCIMKAAHYVPTDSKLVQTLLKYYEKYTGLQGYGVVIDGNTYVYDVENGVAFGCQMPGIDNCMHLENEFVRISDLITSAKIYTAAIVELCS